MSLSSNATKVRIESKSPSVLVGDKMGMEQPIYTPRLLRVYDVLILQLVAGGIFRCSRRRLIRHYRENIQKRHLDCGVGTGFFIEQTADAAGLETLCLLDLNRNSLDEAARRLAAFDPVVCQHNLLAPLPTDLGTFSRSE